MQRIMVVDDEALVLFDLVMTVEDLGYAVFCDSISVPEALECLGDDCPDAALLDIDVGGTLVWPLARVLKERGCPISFVSANSAHQELQDEFAEAAFIDKPASSQQIAKTLETLLSTTPTEQKVVASRA
ncbi:hypothetical protein K3148_01310 [Qipengyuania aurantiaca]|uniref:Response regulatory domain-containing protein n=1 Tax=Qipengyuania aurantiaca TaxID=2867233 RepID=A0ABX8ZM80_9SPHN|nr:hypothetical protein [Qipengyuania aurantiaca]QZD90077.1 hypothetical protein K3148_01310 [Qipengyuania aurantiaca]